MSGNNGSRGSRFSARLKAIEEAQIHINQSQGLIMMALNEIMKHLGLLPGTPRTPEDCGFKLKLVDKEKKP